MNAGIRLEKEQDALRRLELSLDYCPNCGGEADNGHSRDVPPVPYFCKACSVPKTVWNCHKCFPKLCRCEDRNEAPNVEHNRRPQGVRVDGPVGPHSESEE